MADPVYFDSSVFLAIFMGESSGPSIKELLKELKRDKVKIYTSIITIQEVSVQTFRKGALAADNYTKVSKLARIEGITKEIALTAAKLEAHLIDQTKPKDREDNKRRKWDCFHIATAMELRCRTFYALDEKMLKRKDSLGITTMAFAKPVPSALPLFREVEGAIDVKAKESESEPENHVDLSQELPDEKKSDSKTDAPQTTAQDSPAIQGDSGGHPESEAAREAETKRTLDEYGKKVGS